LWVRIPPGTWMFVSFACCQVEVSASGSSLAHRSPTVDGVSECDREASKADTTGRSGGKKRERERTGEFARCWPH
jgi:hypothetical protein